MKPNRRSYLILWLSTLLLGALACGGGGGGGGGQKSLWNVQGTSSLGAPDPSDNSPAGRVCNSAATGAGPLPSTQISIVQQDSTLTANETTGDGLAFVGTVNPDQSFTLTSTTPISEQEGACVVSGIAIVDFFNVIGNQADVNVDFNLDGNSACPFHCTVNFETTATKVG